MATNVIKSKDVKDLEELFKKNPILPAQTIQKRFPPSYHASGLIFKALDEMNEHDFYNYCKGIRDLFKATNN